MKIVYLLATEKGWGGLEKHVFDVASAMASRGHDVVVLCSQNYREHCPNNVKIEPFDWQGARRNPLLWYRLRHKLRRLNPDVVHAQADKPAYVLSKSGWPSGCLSVGTVHNIKSGYSSYARLDALVAVSGMIANDLDHPDITVVHNGVLETNPDLIVQKDLIEWMKGKPSPLLLAIGRLVSAKGFDLLLQAWPKSISGTLVVLGEGKERENLEAIIAARDLKNVHLLGESECVREWISLSDLLVISSRNEGGPYVLSEALINGVAAIGTNVGMVPDYLPVENRVSVGDVDALNDLLVSVLENPDAYKNNCIEAIKKAKLSLSVEAMMNAVEKVYSDRIQRAN